MKSLVFALLLAIAGQSTCFAAERYDGLYELWSDCVVNNCYNFATGIKTNKYAHPGIGSGKKFEIYSCEDRDGQLGLVHAAQNDGLVHVKSPDQCESGQKVAALAVYPDNEYHWYRRIDETGVWMHKPGWCSPTDRDRRGRIIHDIETADRGWYKVFCGYFCVGDDVRVEGNPQSEF